MSEISRALYLTYHRHQKMQGGRRVRLGVSNPIPVPAVGEMMDDVVDAAEDLVRRALEAELQELREVSDDLDSQLGRGEISETEYGERYHALENTADGVIATGRRLGLDFDGKGWV